MSTLFQGASGFMVTGGTFNAISQTTNVSQPKRGIDRLLESIAPDALHDSADQYDAPKCHPRTRVAVLEDIMHWVIESESEALDEFIMWIYGSAGAGKSAIARKIAELAAEKGLLIGTFFFSRTSPTRSTQDRLVATLAYQLAVAIPGIRTQIEDAIERDPAIFKKSLHTQINHLLIKPFQSMSTDTSPFPKLIIIDGLDECTNSQAQIAFLDAISCSFSATKLPIRCLVVSRPETHLVTSFNSNKPLKFIHRRLALDDDYHSDNDIRLFLSDKFEAIHSTHRLRSTIPIPWPTDKSLDALVWKSSGQFIFAATVVRFVESDRHRPAARLNIILGISSPGKINPFTELDALYKEILSSVEDVQLTLHVLSLYIVSHNLAYKLDEISMTEQFLSLEEGDIDRALINLPSLVSCCCNELWGEVKILQVHASLVDFLSDPRRSDEFYIDMASACADFACRTFQCVKGPDGILAGDIIVLDAGITSDWILTGQLRNEILNFDLDAFVMATTKSSRRYDIIEVLNIWWIRIFQMGLEDGDLQLLINRWRNSFESRMQKYQSDRRLQVLLTVAFDRLLPSIYAKCLDILLEMDNPTLHIDRDALNLRYSYGVYYIAAGADHMEDIISRYVDGDKYASAALHCMRFLSNPPKYSDSNGGLEMGITYAEWKDTNEMALDYLPSFLDKASTSPEVMQYINDHDISTTVQKHCPIIKIWQVDTYILAFLARGGVCVNWRIISAIRRGLSPTNKSAATSSRPLGGFQSW